MTNKKTYLAPNTDIFTLGVKDRLMQEWPPSAGNAHGDPDGQNGNFHAPHRYPTL